MVALKSVALLSIFGSFRWNKYSRSDNAWQ